MSSLTHCERRRFFGPGSTALQNSVLRSKLAIGGLGGRRRPTERSQAFLVNRSSRGATDAVTYLSEPLPRGWGTTFLAGGNWQRLNDTNGDGWADLAGYTRGEVRPRVFWDNHRTEG